jgi:hypothetical protein
MVGSGLPEDNERKSGDRGDGMGIKGKLTAIERKAENQGSSPDTEAATSKQGERWGDAWDYG